MSVSCVPYVPDPENTRQLHVALQLFRKFEQYPQALRIAMQLQDQSLIQEIFFDCKDKWVPGVDRQQGGGGYGNTSYGRLYIHHTWQWPV